MRKDQILPTKYYATYAAYKRDCIKYGLTPRKSSWAAYNTLEGYLRHKYSSVMKHRIGGNAHRGNGTLCKSWIGQPICSFEEFKVKSLRSRHLVKVLWPQYIASNRYEELSPSIDRIDESKGYAIDNIRWITKRQNTLKAAAKRRKVRIGKRYAA